MTGENLYSFKPALLRKTRSYRVHNQTVIAHRPDGNDIIVQFEAVTALRYSETTAREYSFRRLDISYGQDKKLQIGLTLPRTANPQSDKNLMAFYNLMQALAKNIQIIKPDVQVVIGETAHVRWVYFIIGLLSALGGAGILLWAYLGGVSEQKLMKGLLPMLVLIGFGVFLCAMSTPWAKRPEIPLKLFAKMIEKLRAG